MPIFQKILKKYRFFFYNREINKLIRKKKVVNYYNAKKIGLIYDSSTEENYLLITDYTRRLQQDNKKIETMGFVRQKKKPHYCFPKLIFGFFSAKDFSWNYKPKHSFLNEFIQTEFDVLIDLSPDDIFHTKHIAGLSKAKYKVGMYSKDFLKIYDLLIEVHDSCSINEFFEHSIHYLKTINIQKTDA